MSIHTYTIIWTQKCKDFEVWKPNTLQILIYFRREHLTQTQQ